MTSYSNQRKEGGERKLEFEAPVQKSNLLRNAISKFHYLLLLLVPILYLLTLARDLVFGDPSEFTFVANILGIAHPPGYAFITLLGKLFQSLVPIGEIPWRMHLLSAVMATLAVLFVYGTVQCVAAATPWVTGNVPRLDKLVAAFTALTVATAADWWQHAIHANPHIITATFLAANLFFLTKWWAAERQSLVDKTPQEKQAGTASSRLDDTRALISNCWLFAFAFSAGLGITHHPLTVFSFLAYALFILIVRPSIWREWRTLLKLVALFLLGLTIWLYFPIRSAMQPVFGPHDMYTLDGFLDHVLGRGITESLPFFGMADQLNRATVFWTLLRLQYALPIILLSLWGLVWLASDSRKRRAEMDAQGNDGRVRHTTVQENEHQPAGGTSFHPLALLYGLALVSNYLFVINLRQQDIMAYLLGVFLLIGLLAGIGLWGLLVMLQGRVNLDRMALGLLLGALLLLGPVLQIVRNAPHISLQDYDAAATYLAAVFDWFAGQGEGAVLLNDWEHMTPIWYEQYVEGHQLDPADVEPMLVSTKMPWLESVTHYLPGGPVYLSGYRPEIVDAGFRLRPRGPFYEVVEPGETDLPPELTKIEPAQVGDLEIVAYQLADGEYEAGDYVPLTLAMGTPTGTEAYYVPALLLGDGENQLRYEFTTDSHLTTPLWQPGEVIVERFDFALPLDMPVGTYPLILGIRNLSDGENSNFALPLGEITVREPARPAISARLLANFRQRVGLVSAGARAGLAQRRAAPWDEPLRVRPGDTIQLTLEWESLAPAEESYTVFVHLIDLANRPLVTLDYTPLGGSAPTHLWIPKWLPGQRMLDPYRLEIPEDLAPGEYLIEVGLYEMTGRRRLHISDPAGNLVGDRYILGNIVVE